jgi:nucleoside-diphosphate-sugar epimerase
MKSILIIGKKSFIGSNLKNYLKKFYRVDCLTFEDVIKKDISFFENFSHVINTSIHKNYINERYRLINDLDRKFILKFKKINFIYIFLNTRKIYLPNSNISENSIKKPSCFYSKNKLKTEQFLKKQLKSKLLSLRIGNIIGKKKFKNQRNNHNLFFDNYLILRKRNEKISIDNDFKDFLSIIQFCRIVRDLVKNNVIGIYNVSISKKIFLSEILYWLDKKFYKKIKFTNYSSDSFSLNNKKLLKRIVKKPLKSELKNFCEKILS